MMDSKLFTVFSVGKKESCRMGIHSVFKFLKRGVIGFGNLCKTKLTSSTAKITKWGLAPRLFPDLQGCAVLALLGLEREARQGLCQGSGLPFSLTELPDPVLMQRSCCVCAVHRCPHGQARAVVTQCQVLLGNCFVRKKRVFTSIA